MAKVFSSFNVEGLHTHLIGFQTPILKAIYTRLKHVHADLLNLIKTCLIINHTNKSLQF